MPTLDNRYVVVSNESVVSVCNEVNDYLSKGYDLHGPLATCPTLHGKTIYSQALISK